MKYMDQEVKEILTHLVRSVDGLTTTVADMQADIADMKADIKGIHTEIADMKADINGIHTEIAGMKSDINGIHTEMAGMKADIKGLRSDVTALQKDMKWMKVRQNETYYIVQAVRERQEFMTATMDDFDHKKATFEYVNALNEKIDTRLTKLEQAMAAG